MGRPGLSDGQKSERWQRWKAGESLSDIGRQIGLAITVEIGIARPRSGNRGNQPSHARKSEMTCEHEAPYRYRQPLHSYP